MHDRPTVSPGDGRLSGPSGLTRYCDLIMMGDIACGIVYPLALAELSEAFTFRSGWPGT